MSASLGRWRDSNPTTGVHARQIPVDAHEGDHRDFLRRHERAANEAVQKGRVGLEEIGPLLLDRTADTRTLRIAWDHLKQYGGQAPGPNRLTYDSLENSEVWELVRVLRQAIKADTFRPGPERKVRIPKTSGKGYRTLSLQNIEDRAVGRAIVEILQPLLEPIFDENSFGYRPHRDRQHALVKARQRVDSGNKVWLVEDIKDAFDHVPLNRLLDILRKLLPKAAEFTRLIQRVIRNGTKRGLRQGSPLSPLLLNVYLDHVLDKVWRKESPDTPLIRVADDLLIPCCTEQEARKAHALLRQILLPTGMRLKGDPKGNGNFTTHNLQQGDHVDWLGFQVSIGKQRGKEGLEVRIAEKAWWKLAEEMELAHTKAAAPLRVRSMVDGWVAQMGPCFPFDDHAQVYARVEAIAHKLAFDELPDEDEFRWNWSAAYARWCRLRGAVAESSNGPSGGSTRHVFFSATRDRRSDGAHGGAPSLSFDSDEPVTLYTDGSCDRLTKQGGWAAILMAPSLANPVRGSGALTRTTNNRAELIAVIEGLERLEGPARVKVVSDSKYVTYGIAEGLPKWKAQGWRAGSGRHKRTLQNADLWKKLDVLIEPHTVTCEWVRGHSGNTLNEACDRLAVAAMERAAA